jgi:hypothetical protein
MTPNCLCARWTPAPSMMMKIGFFETQFYLHKILKLHFVKICHNRILWCSNNFFFNNIVKFFYFTFPFYVNFLVFFNFLSWQQCSDSRNKNSNYFEYRIFSNIDLGFTFLIPLKFFIKCLGLPLKRGRYY